MEAAEKAAWDLANIWLEKTRNVAKCLTMTYAYFSTSY
jgi:hypothetical protein